MDEIALNFTPGRQVAPSVTIVRSMLRPFIATNYELGAKGVMNTLSTTGPLAGRVGEGLYQHKSVNEYVAWRRTSPDSPLRRVYLHPLMHGRGLMLHAILSELRNNGQAPGLTWVDGTTDFEHLGTFRKTHTAPHKEVLANQYVHPPHEDRYAYRERHPELFRHLKHVWGINLVLTSHAVGGECSISTRPISEADSKNPLLRSGHGYTDAVFREGEVHTFKPEAGDLYIVTGDYLHNYGAVPDGEARITLTCFVGWCEQRGFICWN